MFRERRALTLLIEVFNKVVNDFNDLKDLKFFLRSG